jgi:hypothetical protein
VSRTRAITGVSLIAVLLAAATGIVSWRAGTVTPQDRGQLQLGRSDSVVYVDGGTNRVQQATREGQPVGTGPTCQRAAVAQDTLVCLYSLPGPMSSEVRVYRNGAMSPQLTLPVWGEPSRARVSPSGRLVAWTVFRTGDSYAVPGQFATTAGIYDLRTGEHYGSLEDFTPIVDGKTEVRDDRNFWGVTFADDDRTFYATMSSRGTTWLMRGDLHTRELTALRRNVECPSLAPDGNRIAYKKRIDDRWRLHVLDLESGTDTTLAESADIDDQAAWLNDNTITYSKPDGRTPTVYAVPADGSGTPKRLFRGASPTFTTPAATSR